MSGLWRAALSQRLAVYALVTILVLAGLTAVGALPQAVYPNLDLSRVNVRVERGDLAPSLVQSSLTRPLERELSAVLGVQQLVATSTQGAADITLTFDPRVASTNVALQRVSTAVGAVEASLPKGTAVRIQQVGTNLFPVLSYALTSDALTQMQLREAVEYQIRPQLIGLPGVALVTVLGGDVREYLVSVDPRRLAAHGLSLERLTSAIAQTNQIDAVGHADSGYVRSTILASGMAHSVGDLANIPLAAKDGRPLTVGTVASVIEAAAPPTVRASTLGKNAVILNVFAQPRASYVGVAHTAAAAMETALSGVPDVRANRFWDQSILVSAAIDNLRDAILIGLALSTLVLLFFLRNWRMTLVAGVVIPLTIVITFGVMRLLGQGLNLMTLGGLAIGVGLVIDDAIVVVENISRHMGRGEDRQAAVVTAVGEIAGPMTTSTLTTIVVFAPLSLLSGIPGAFFTALSISLSAALIVSLILAFVFTPNVALQAAREAGTPAQRHRFVGWVNRRYTPLLAGALRCRTPVILGALAILGATVWLGTHLGTDFLPALDEGAFELTYTLPAGTALPETQRVAHEIQGAIDADPAVARSAGIIGASMTLINTDTPQGTSGGTMRATLRPKRSEGIRTVMDRIGDRIRAMAPNTQFSTRQLLQDSLSDLANQQAPIEIRVFGPQQSALVPLATNVASRIGQVPGVDGAFSGVIYHNPSIVVRADPAASAFGVSAAQLAEDERVLFGGALVSDVIQNPLTIPVRVRYDLPLDLNPADLGKIPYVTPGGGVQPLSRLATFMTSPPQSDIQELNARQYLAVTAQISGSNLGAIISGIKRQLAQIDWPPGYTYQIAGSYALQQQSFRQFALAIALSVALVLLVMIAQFRSLLQPLAILTAVPLAAFGAALALYLARISINVSSLMGVILLVGLVVKNGILLLEYAAANQRRGQSTQTALIAAGQIRLRPILMTTLTALLGMLPLAFGIGSGSELLQPLAVAIIGGLAFSTLFTLIVVPVVFATFVDLDRRVNGGIPPREDTTDLPASPIHV
jgi:multidrug efflux pump subunit AcrB